MAFFDDLYSGLTKTLADPVAGLGMGMLAGSLPGANPSVGLQAGMNNAFRLREQQMRQQAAVEEMLYRSEQLRMKTEQQQYDRQQAATNAAAAGLLPGMDATSKQREAISQGLQPGTPAWAEAMQGGPLVTVNTAQPLPPRPEPLSDTDKKTYGFPLDSTVIWDENNQPKVLESGKTRGDEFTAFSRTEDAYSRYREQLQGFGTKIIPSGEKLKLKGHYNDLLLEAKELFKLGVLSGPDMDLMNAVMQDPTIWESQFYSGDALLEQLDSVIGTKLQDARTRLEQRYGEAPEPRAAITQEQPQTAAPMGAPPGFTVPVQ